MGGSLPYKNSWHLMEESVFVSASEESLAAFQARQKAKGAVFTDEVANTIRTIEFDPDGYPIVPAFEPLGPPKQAVHYGDPRQEFEWANTKAVVFDLSHRGHLEIVGEDRHKFLNGYCTAEIQNLPPGEGCETFLPNIKGKVIGHGFVFAGENSIWLDTVPDSVQPLMAHLSHYALTADVDFLPRSSEVGELYISGPEAIEKLKRREIEVSELPLYGHLETQLKNTPVHVCRVDWFDQPGYLLRFPLAELAEAWDRVRRTGFRPAGIAVFHSLRIQAGLPIYGIDITEDNLAQEVNRTQQAINFKKGCYLGQEPIARIDALGHVNRELRTIQLESVQPPLPGGEIQDASGKAIGQITSYAMNPKKHRPVALAYLKREALKPGTEVFVVGDEEDLLPAKVI